MMDNAKERWKASGFKPDGWGETGRIPWNKGKSKYASEEERKQAARDRAREWAKKNPDRVRAKQRKYNRSEKGKATHKAWRDANRERLSAKKKQWAKEHPESRKATQYCYRQNHFAEIKKREWQKRKERELKEKWQFDALALELAFMQHLEIKKRPEWTEKDSEDLEHWCHALMQVASQMDAGQKKTKTNECGTLVNFEDIPQILNNIAVMACRMVLSGALKNA